MKKTISFFAVIVLLIGLAIPVWGETTLVSDNAGLLLPAQIQELQAIADSLLAQFDTAVVIRTEDGLDKNIEDYARQLYNSEYASVSPDCILFIIDMDERDWTVRTYENAVDFLTDREIDGLMESVLPRLSDGDYHAAFSLFLRSVQGELADAPTPGTEAPAGDGNYVVRILVSLVIGAVVAGIALLVMRGQMNTARSQSGARSYVVEGSYDLYRCMDLFLYSNIQRVRKPDPPKSGGSGGSRSGGRSGKF